MPNWKKVVVSGSSPTLSGLTSDGNVEITGSLSITGSSSPLISLPNAPTNAVIISGSSDRTRLHIYESVENNSPEYTEGAGIKLVGGEGSGHQATLELSAVGSANGGGNNEQTFIHSNQQLVIQAADNDAGNNIKIVGGDTRYGWKFDAPGAGDVTLSFNTNGGSTVSELNMGNGTYIKADASGTYYKIGRSSTDWLNLSSTAATFAGDITSSGDISLPSSGQSINFISNAGIYGRTGGSYPGLHIASGNSSNARIWIGDQFNTTGPVTASFLGLGKITNIATIEPHGNHPFKIRGGAGPNDANDGIQMYTNDDSNDEHLRFEIEADADTVDAYFTNINGLGINKTSGFAAELDVSGDINASGDITSSKFLGDNFVKNGGTSAQFLKADGSVDSNTYSTATGVENNADVTDATNVAAAGALMASNNLSDLSSAATARDNLGLGSVATTAANAYLAVSNNLSDVSNAATARTNLGSAKTGANSDITSLSGLTTALSVAQGGTGLTELGDASSFLTTNGDGNALEFNSSPTFRATDGTSTAPGISFSSDTNTGFYRSGNDELSIAIGGSQIGYFNSNGIQLNSGIGTSQIGGHLQAHCLGVGTTPSGTQGEIRATGDIIANYSSDRRLKKYIKNIPNALEKVSQINGVSFEWKKADEKIKREVHSHEGHDVGVIAQEVEEVLPEVVSTRDNGYKAVNYEKIVPLLIEAIKDLKAEIDELKKSK